MDVSLLKTIPLFADVPDEQLRKIAPFAETDEFVDGQVVVKEGGYSNHFFAIEEGTAKVERNGERIGDLGPGDVFGEQGLLEKQERSATVTATFSHLASIWSRTSESRSWVIGRGVEAPWSFIRIAAASGWPIQIGRNLLPSTVFRSTIGCLPTMSKLTP